MLVMASLTTTLPNSLLVNAQSGTHVVESGEYLLSIANQYGVTVEELRVWNGLSSDLLEVGDVLIVSPADVENIAEVAPNAGTYTVVSGDSLYSIAQRYGVSVGNLMAWNGLSTDWLNVGDTIVVYGDAQATVDYQPETPTTVTPSAPAGYYTVVTGDTLSGIAAAFGVSEYDLMAWNGLSSDWLNAGDVLTVYGYVAPSTEYVPTQTTTVTNATGSYTVVSGDNLSTIALSYGITVDDLMAINGLTSTFLQVGDVLAVPGTTTTDSTSSTTTTESTTQTTTQQDDTETITDEEREAGVKAKYTVVAGDNLWRIANRFNVTVHNLQVWNELDEDQPIQVGDVLVIKQAEYTPTEHTVLENETLESIAAEYATTVERLREWNELDENADPAVGDELFVSDPEPTIHQVENGEILTQIAQRYGVSVEQLREWNELPAASVVVNGKLVVSDPTGVFVAEVTETTEQTTQQETTTESDN